MKAKPNSNSTEVQGVSMVKSTMHEEMVAGRYLVGEFLGSGATAQVKAAVDFQASSETTDAVALKIFNAKR